jgi:hypothetical protein
MFAIPVATYINMIRLVFFAIPLGQPPVVVDCNQPIGSDLRIRRIELANSESGDT